MVQPGRMCSPCYVARRGRPDGDELTPRGRVRRINGVAIPPAPRREDAAETRRVGERGGRRWR
jgi:hypothetical protein